MHLALDRCRSLQVELNLILYTNHCRFTRRVVDLQFCRFYIPVAFCSSHLHSFCRSFASIFIGRFTRCRSLSIVAFCRSLHSFTVLSTFHSFARSRCKILQVDRWLSIDHYIFILYILHISFTYLSFTSLHYTVHIFYIVRSIYIFTCRSFASSVEFWFCRHWSSLICQFPHLILEFRYRRSAVHTCRSFCRRSYITSLHTLLYTFCILRSTFLLDLHFTCIGTWLHFHFYFLHHIYMMIILFRSFSFTYIFAYMPCCTAIPFLHFCWILSIIAFHTIVLSIIDEYTVDFTSRFYMSNFTSFTFSFCTFHRSFSFAFCCTRCRFHFCRRSLSIVHCHIYHCTSCRYHSGYSSFCTFSFSFFCTCIAFSRTSFASFASCTFVCIDAGRPTLQVDRCKSIFYIILSIDRCRTPTCITCTSFASPFSFYSSRFCTYILHTVHVFTFLHARFCRAYMPYIPYIPAWMHGYIHLLKLSIYKCRSFVVDIRSFTFYIAFVAFTFTSFIFYLLSWSLRSFTVLSIYIHLLHCIHSFHLHLLYIRCRVHFVDLSFAFCTSLHSFLQIVALRWSCTHVTRCVLLRWSSIFCYILHFALLHSLLSLSILSIVTVRCRSILHVRCRSFWLHCIRFIRSVDHYIDRVTRSRLHSSVDLHRLHLLHLHSLHFCTFLMPDFAFILQILHFTFTRTFTLQFCRSTHSFCTCRSFRSFIASIFWFSVHVHSLHVHFAFYIFTSFCIGYMLHRFCVHVLLYIVLPSIFCRSFCRTYVHGYILHAVEFCRILHVGYIVLPVLSIILSSSLHGYIPTLHDHVHFFVRFHVLPFVHCIFASCVHFRSSSTFYIFTYIYVHILELINRYIL